MRKLLDFIVIAVVLLSIGAIARADKAETPADQVRWALEDARELSRKLGPDAVKGVRYLTFYAVDPKNVGDAKRAAIFVLNAVSRRRGIDIPVALDDHHNIIRIRVISYASRDLKRGQKTPDYDQWAETWEKIASIDAYFHIVSEDQSPIDGKISKQLAAGGWTDLAAHGELSRLTGSYAPIVRADQFVSLAASAPFYYDFAGVPATKDEFVKSLGLDLETIEELRANSAANLIRSKITKKPRRIVWSQGPLGAYIETLDTSNVNAVRDPFRRPIDVDDSKFKHDASEIFAMQPNGLWRVALYDANGKRQNAVPPEIAKDDRDPRGDGQVIPMISCYRCHEDAGMQTFTDDQQRLLFGRNIFQSYSAEVVQRAVEFYDSPRLQREIEFNRETYTSAARAATQGESPGSIAKILTEVFGQYAYEQVSPESAAREAGYASLAEFREKLAPSRDPIILFLRDGRSVHRSQWEASFQEAALIAAGMPCPQPVAKQPVKEQGGRG